jgi:hypothetical protein
MVFALLRYGDAEDSNGLHGHDMFGGALTFCKAHFSVSSPYTPKPSLTATKLPSWLEIGSDRFSSHLPEQEEPCQVCQPAHQGCDRSLPRRTAWVGSRCKAPPSLHSSFLQKNPRREPTAVESLDTDQAQRPHAASDEQHGISRNLCSNRAQLPMIMANISSSPPCSQQRALPRAKGVQGQAAVG